MHLLEDFNGRLRYSLPRALTEVPLAAMFGLLEAAKHDCLTDYAVSQTTLEQIFVTFAKYQDNANS
jgi:hypothetical protein